MKIFKVGIYGAGVVAGGVVELLRSRAAMFKQYGLKFEVTTVSTLDDAEALISIREVCVCLRSS